MLKMTDILQTLKQELAEEFPSASIYTSEIQGLSDGSGLCIYIAPETRFREYTLSHHEDVFGVQIAVETLFKTQEDDLALWDAVDQIVDKYAVGNSSLTVTAAESTYKLLINNMSVKYTQAPSMRRQGFLHYGIVTLRFTIHNKN